MAIAMFESRRPRVLTISNYGKLRVEVEILRIIEY
jgi:hypothetical protein